MGATRREQLADRLAARIEQAPRKGRAISAPPAEPIAARPVPARDRRDAVSPARGATVPAGRGGGDRPASRTRAASPVAATIEHEPRLLRRGSAGTVIRGHLVGEDVHRRARRRKAELRLERGRSVTWSEVVTEALTALLAGDPGRLDRPATSGERAQRRLVQATIPVELDRALVRAHLELNDRSPVTYESLWERALDRWSSGHR